MAREDTFLEIRGHLAGLTDEELEARFWELTQEIVDPLVELARTHTSPSIERRVLMRMGIDSPTCDGGRRRVRDARAARPRRRARGAALRDARGAATCAEAARRLADGDGWDTVEAKWGGAP